MLKHTRQSWIAVYIVFILMTITMLSCSRELSEVAEDGVAVADPGEPGGINIEFVVLYSLPLVNIEDSLMLEWTGSLSESDVTSTGDRHAASDNPIEAELRLVDNVFPEKDNLHPGKWEFEVTGKVLKPDGTYTIAFTVSNQPATIWAGAPRTLTINENGQSWPSGPGGGEPLGTIIIDKKTEGGDGSFSFTSNIPDHPEIPSVTSDGNWSKSIFNLSPGEYEITENAPSLPWVFSNLTCQDQDDNGTDSSVDISQRKATIHLDQAETVSCIYTNIKRGTIIIEKNFTGSDGSFTFEGTGGIGGFQINGTDGSTIPETINNLTNGNYTITEETQPGWVVSDVNCVDSMNDGSSSTATEAVAQIALDAGETVTCTFSNFCGAPTVSSINPVSVLRGTESHPVFIAGENFSNEATVNFVYSGAGAGNPQPGVNCTVLDSKHIDCSVDVGSGGQANRSFNVVVENPSPCLGNDILTEGFVIQ